MSMHEEYRSYTIRDVRDMHRITSLAVYDCGLEEASKQSATHFPLQSGSRSISILNKYLPRKQKLPQP